MKLLNLVKQILNEQINFRDQISHIQFPKIDMHDENKALQIVTQTNVKIINDRLGIKLNPNKFTIKYGNSSSTFDNHITIKLKKWHWKKNPNDFFLIVLHELCHVIDNRFTGYTISKFSNEKIYKTISGSKNWLEIPLESSPTIYGTTNKTEDFVETCVAVCLGLFNKLSSDRKSFMVKIFPNIKK